MLTSGFSSMASLVQWMKTADAANSSDPWIVTDMLSHPSFSPALAVQGVYVGAGCVAGVPLGAAAGSAIGSAGGPLGAAAGAAVGGVAGCITGGADAYATSAPIGFS